MQLIQGSLIAEKIEKQIKEEISALSKRKPGLAFIRVGENPASKVYIRMKKKKCAEVGIVSYDEELSEKTSKEELIAVIHRLNKDPTIDGILLQLPLPSHLDPLRIIEEIDPKKDVDGFHPLNMGKLLLGELDGFIPCTPKGIHRLLVDSSLSISGKHVVIVGRSNIVGKPLAALLMQKDPSCNATVTIAHSGSKNLPSLCKEADILIAAIGKPRFITKDMIRPGAVIIDVGINRDPNSKNLLGDVDFLNVAPLSSWITPVPGGVGPMTIAMLLLNTFQGYTNDGVHT
jgi:methylenetetrahydrofolate dehydrogenase (NADP+)/methenyltetrahydrofolate cyclohydrolase